MLSETYNDEKEYRNQRSKSHVFQMEYKQRDESSSERVQ